MSFSSGPTVLRKCIKDGSSSWRIAIHIVLRARRSVVFAVVLLAALAGTLARAQDFLVTHVRVFDGRETRPSTHVAVTQGVIRAIGGDLSPWKRLPVIDGSGLTLVPGLIDAHVHVRNLGDARQALRFGVTTVLDMGTVSVTQEALAAMRATANAASDMADIRSAGYPATSPRGHMTEFRAFIPTVSKATNVAEFVAMRREEGSDYLKVVLHR